jgi:hypothetical protein
VRRRGPDRSQTTGKTAPASTAHIDTAAAMASTSSSVSVGPGVRKSSEVYEASRLRSESRVDGPQHVIGRGLRRPRAIDREGVRATTG